MASTMTEAAAVAFSQDELQRHFSAVCDKSDWRAPISARVAAADLAITLLAIEFFVGAPAYVVGTLHDRNGRPESYRVASVGYRMGPCGP